MKKLKIILQHSFIYYFLLVVVLISYFICNNKEYISVYKGFNNEEFIITNIVVKDYGLKLDLKGKEKVVGFLYCAEDEALSFLNSYNLGDKVLLSGDVIELSNNTVLNTFNYKKYLNSNGIYSSVSITLIEKMSDNKNIFYLVKNVLLDRTMELSKSYPYINSLIFGNNNYLDEDVVSSYRDNGVSHLFAISGLHISIFMFLLGHFIDKFRFNNFIKSILLILFLIFYMFLTNFSMSVMRGAIFTILIFMNKLFELRISNKNLLIFTLVLILLFNPLYLNNVGLKYSFLVTFLLIMFSSLISGSKLKQLFMISFIAFLVSYPITINNFYQVNFLSIIYNMFFVPYVSSLLLPLVLIGYVFPFMDSIIYFFVRIIEIVSQFLYCIEFAKISFCKMSMSSVVSYYVIIWVLLKSMMKGKYKTLFLVVLFFVLHYFMPFKSDDYVMFFDVGQGDSSLISVNKSYTFIDTGGVVMYSDKEYTYKIVKNKLIPYFKSVGIKKIDNLVLTHGDADHMKEAKYLIENFYVGKVIFNCGEFNYLENELIEVLDKKNIEYSSCIEELDIGDDKLYFLNDKIYDNENDNSSVIYTKLNNYKFLFMGDAGVDVENDILEKYDLSDMDVLKVGHHGSKTSSGFDFISVVKPKYSVISVGKNNRFGHPVDEVLDNLEKSKIYRTDQDGSIMFKIKKNNLQIETCVP